MTGMDIWQQILIGIATGLIVFLIVSIIEFIIEFITGRKIIKSRKLKNLLIVTIVILVVLFVAFKYQPFPESPQIQITDPKEGDNVPWEYTVKGTSNLSHNSDLNIYVFIYGNNWYAQPKAVISSNGDWETRDRCKFGEPEYSGLGYTYDICAIVTKEYFEVDEQFQELPDYINKSDTIKVTRE